MSLLSGVQLEALVPDGHRLTAWPSSSSTREAKRLTHGRLRGALRLDPGELPAGVNAVLIEADADATPLADEIGRGLQAVGVAVQIGERQQGDVAKAGDGSGRSGPNLYQRFFRGVHGATSGERE